MTTGGPFDAINPAVVAAQSIVREWDEPFLKFTTDELRCEHNAAIRHLRAENEALRKDNEKRSKNFWEMAAEFVKTGSQLKESEATAARLREALGEFGRHWQFCTHVTSNHEQTCDCGLSAALEGAKPNG